MMNTTMSKPSFYWRYFYLNMSEHVSKKEVGGKKVISLLKEFYVMFLL